jgi:cell wall-associated NlpC family hydrolase
MSASGLNLVQRQRARKRVLVSAYLTLKHAPSVHYTQGPRRWEGIDKHRRAYRGEYPTYCDCSAFATWCIWDATLRYKPRDFVNNQGWRAGYTGTQQSNGRRVTGRKLPGDLVFYGNQGGGIAQHVAIYVGKGLVISHGSEGGPYLLRWDYRDVSEVRRYIR